MKKRNIIIVISSIILLLSICTFIFVKKYDLFKNKINPKIDEDETVVEIINEEELLEKDSDGKIIDKETGSVLFDPKTNYSETIDIDRALLKGKTPNEYSSTDIVEYLKYIFYVYHERSFNKFNEEEVAAIVSIASMFYIPRTEEEIKKVAKAYFNIDNYELPTGTYNLKNYGKFTITKIDGYYIKSSVIDRVPFIMAEHLKNITINNNEIEVFYDYASNGDFYEEGCYHQALEIQEEGCIIGTYKVHLTYYDEEDRLNIDKIVYEKTDKYDE